MKLNLDDLDVTSFEVTVQSSQSYQYVIGAKEPALTTDPTAATRCFYCPPATADCY